MSKKHNTKHFRTPGGYRRRLERRGLKATPVMEDAAILETRQRRRANPWDDEDAVPVHRLGWS